MHRLLATLIKELHILRRDKTGIALLFIMPLCLVFLMTLIQHEAYKSLNETGIPVLFVNHDNDSLGLAIEQGFNHTTLFQLSTDHGEKYSELSAVKKTVLDGEYLVAVIVPEGATEILRQDIGNIMDHFFEGTPLTEEEMAQVEIEIIVDPIARKSFVVAITGGLKEFIASIKTRVIFQLMAERMVEFSPEGSELSIPETDFFVFNEDYALEDDKFQPNAVQHNIPAWAIFSMFFIVIPLAVSIINERTEGLYIRLRTFPGNYLSILSGKLLVYFLVAVLQFVVILQVGMHIMPLLGLPALNVGENNFALSIMVLAVSMAAVGYALLVGTLFDTSAQSSIFGGISILLMAAIGGIWVPVNIMPDIMQKLSEVSPLNWALTGFYELFIKGGGWKEIQIHVLKLALFFIISLGLAYRLYILKRRFQ